MTAVADNPTGCRFCLRASVALAFLLVLLSFIHGCARTTGYRPPPEQTGQVENGVASYYARNFQHRKTASGERLDNQAMTAAHKTLPFGTEVLVKNVKNGKSVRVRINDRGPFVKGRVIDMTRAAFSQIASLDKGIAKVEIRVVE